MRFDLLIKNGTVVDPAAGLHARADVGVTRARIAAVGPSIPEQSAAETYDAAGAYVTPGLVDFHTHVFRKATFWGVQADAVASRSGVTTWVDAGSAGAFTIDGFREFIVRPSTVRIHAFLNVSCVGLVAHDYELTNMALCDPDLFALMINANRDLVIGGKVRLGGSTVGETGFEALRLARAALDRCGLPLMLHIAERPPHPEEFADLLHEGDVLTHCFTRWDMGLLDERGALRPYAREWIDRGVLLDIGHGTGSFSFPVAEALLGMGIKPHFISTDIHQNSMRGPMYDLPTCLTKFLALGLGVDEVIARATVAPAKFLGLEREIGTLREGAHADIAVFDLVAEPVELYDTDWRVRRTDRALRHRATFVGGRRLPLAEEEPAPRYLEWKRGGRDEMLYARQAATPWPAVSLRP